MLDVIQRLLSGEGFTPHGDPYLWEPGLVRLHFLSDVSIGIAYIAISLTLVFLALRAKHLTPFHWAFWVFSAAIMACGATHLMEAWTIWTPVHWISGGVKLATALAAVTTALVLPSLVPKTLHLIRNAQLSEERRCRLESAHQELENLHDRLAQSARLERRFFTNLSHELRTPLALILGPVETLSADPTTSRRQQRELEVIEQNARLLLAQIDNLLDLSRFDQGQQKLSEESTDLAGLLRHTASNFDHLAEEHGILFSITTPNSLAVEADAEKLQRAIFNILSHHFQFVRDGGEIDCRMVIENDTIVVVSRDNGPGTPKWLRETVFEHFSSVEAPPSTLSGGAGLGLAIAKEFVELHGGSMEIQDAPGEGTVLRVTLPLRPAEGPPVRLGHLRRLYYSFQRPPSGSDGMQGVEPDLDNELLRQQQEMLYVDHRQLILVVEDNHEMNRFITETLANEYRVVSAFDGDEGLAKALEMKPDLIISDIMMPCMHGDEMVRQLRAHKEFSTVPVVMVTAMADEALRSELLQQYVQDYIIKPVRGPILRARIRNLLQARSRERKLSESEQQLQTLASKLVTIQEEERTRLARELHDDLNQRLAALSLGLASVRSRFSGAQGISEPLESVEAELIVISNQVRQIAHRLHPPALEYLGLAAALESHCADFSKKTAIRVDFRATAVPEHLPPEVATCLFRIAQESLLNAAKHSGAKVAHLSVFREDGMIRLRMVDMGRGFDVDAARASGGLGLLSMQQRVQSLGGYMTIQSVPSQGSAIDVGIPLETEGEVIAETTPGSDQHTGGEWRNNASSESSISG